VLNRLHCNEEGDARSWWGLLCCIPSNGARRDVECTLQHTTLHYITGVKTRRICVSARFQTGINQESALLGECWAEIWFIPVRNAIQPSSLLVVRGVERFHMCEGWTNRMCVGIPIQIPILSTHNIETTWSKATSNCYCGWKAPQTFYSVCKTNHANQMEPRVHLKTRQGIITSYEVLYVTTVREGGTEPWLCRTSAFSLINRLGNWVVVTFFFFHPLPRWCEGLKWVKNPLQCSGKLHRPPRKVACSVPMRGAAGESRGMMPRPVHRTYTWTDGQANSGLLMTDRRRFCDCVTMSLGVLKCTRTRSPGYTFGANVATACDWARRVVFTRFRYVWHTIRGPLPVVCV
jgi:hypothetical protein